MREWDIMKKEWRRVSQTSWTVVPTQRAVESVSIKIFSTWSLIKFVVTESRNDYESEGWLTENS